MIPRSINEFSEVWCVDFEYQQPDGERPHVHCMSAVEWKTGKRLNLWRNELVRLKKAPFPVDTHSLFVAYYAAAEMNSFLSLGWKLPVFILDLFAEFKNLTNGKHVPCGRKLTGALLYCGCDSIGTEEKTEMQKLAQRGAPFLTEEREALLTYCASDVTALIKLLPKMLPAIHLPFALIRGRYTKAVGTMESAGIPIDTNTWERLVRYWEPIKLALIQEQDTEGIYEGTTFKERAWGEWTAKQGIIWPRLVTGGLALNKPAFKSMAEMHPTVVAYKHIRSTIAKMNLSDLAIGKDGRNRTMLSAYSSKTGRNQPSNSKFIFGPSKWLRGLVQPQPGRAIAYLDWEGQEFRIAALLSGDPNMLIACETSDPYLDFARQAQAVPTGATKQTHGRIRSHFKACALGVMYGKGPVTLSVDIGQSEYEARELLRLHRETFKKFWRWSDGAVDCAVLHGSLSTRFGWHIFAQGEKINTRSLRNFPMQATGGELMRLACCLATEKGISVVAPVHDALTIEAAVDEIDDAIAVTRKAMDSASETVLDGYHIPIGEQVCRYPNRFQEEEGAAMWKKVVSLLAEREIADSNRVLAA